MSLNLLGRREAFGPENEDVDFLALSYMETTTTVTTQDDDLVETPPPSREYVRHTT